MIIDDQFGQHENDAVLHLSVSPEGQWILPEELSLFTADFSRDRFDLILQTEDGQTVSLDGYFASQTPADILSSDGAVLRGGVVERLAGPIFPGQYAQVGGTDLADAIGQVETLVGVAFVQRTDGQVVELEIGTKVFQGDVVRTENGGTLGLTFADGTIFTLASGSRMVLDELIYDASASDNSGVFNLIEGSFVFIAGQAAKTGGIEINTPAATMGIRGTTGKIDIETVNGVATVTVSLNPDPDGGLGVIELRDLNGELIANISATDTKWIIRPPFTNEPPIEISRESIDLGEDAPLLNQAIAAFQEAVARVARGETFVEFGEGESEDDQGDQPPEDEGEQPPEEGDVPPQQQQFQEEEAPEEAEPPRPAPLDETGDGTDGTGESGTGNPELDGNDEPLPEQEGQLQFEDEAPVEETINQGDPATETVIRTRFSDLEVEVVEDNTITSLLPIESRTGEPVPVTVTQGPQNGEVTLEEDGRFTYTPNANFEGTDSFVVSGTDESGEVQDSEITVTVDPVNDAPTVSLRQVNATSVEEGSGPATGSGTVSGTLTYLDVDEGEIPGLWSIAATADDGAAFGTITIDPVSGFWEYTLDQEAADTLLDGEVFEETYVAIVTDAEGATDVSTIVITVTGTNDAPVISVAVGETEVSMITGPGAAEETDPTVITTGSVSGTLAYTDVDEGDSPATWTIAADSGNDTAFGTISIDEITGAWRYDLPEDEPIPLNNGETVTEVFTATITDTEGASAQQQISISITGTNDAPTIVFAIEDVTATVVEDGFGTGTEGQISLRVAPDLEGLRLRSSTSDEENGTPRARLDGGPDATGTLRYVDADGASGAASWSVAPDNATLGTMTIDAVTGEWRYFLDEEAANSLRQGDEVIETFIATVTDPFGGNASQVITITVQGSNDEAEIINAPQDLVGTVAEDGVSTATGRLNFFDPDALPGETATWSIEADGGSRGIMEIDPDSGQWTYTLDAVAADSLAAGEPVTETFTATVTDALGATADQTITITLEGVNDGPALVTGSGTVAKSDASVIVDLSALGSDVDAGEDGTTLTYAISGAPTEGSAIVDGLDLIFSTQGDFDDLSEGETREVTIEITATDSFGLSVTDSVVITVTGSDTGPEITSTGADAQGDVIEAGNSTPGNPSVSGTLAYSDPDASTPTSGVWSAVPRSVVFGTLSIDATTGEWTYTLNQAAADQLNDGETAQDIFRATITDEDNQTAIQDITITITGSNDAPGLTAAVGSLAKDDASLTLDLSNFGTDPDAEDDGGSLIYDLDAGPATGNGTASVSGGILTFNTNGDFDGLSDGESAVVTVRVGVTDAQGVRSESDVEITVTGSTSAPVITSGAADAAGDVAETGAAVSGQTVAEGQLTYDDPDAASPTAGNWTITPDTSALGSISIDAATGEWRYVLDDTAADSLNEGETRQEQFTATITDIDGLSDSQIITIDITGSNDAATLVVAPVSVSNETPSLTVSLDLFGADPDAEDDGASLTYDLEAGPGTGNGSVVVSGNDLIFSVGSDFDSLSTGESRDVVVQVGVTDAQGLRTVSDVTFTVTGSTSAPEITSEPGDALGAVAETGAAVTGPTVAQGQLTYTDADAGSATEGVWAIAPDTSALGAMTIDATTGEWRYTLDNFAADSLNDGEEVTETFTATITDLDGLSDSQIVTITITGSNDAPSLVAATGSVVKTAASVSIDLTAFGTDPDDEDDGSSLIYDLDTGPGAAGGSALISGKSLVFSTEGDFDDLSDGETRDVTVRVGVTDAQGLRTVSDVVITVTGSDTAPVITSGPGDAQGAVRETGVGVSGQIVTSGALSYSDPDAATPTSGVWSVLPTSTTPYLGNLTINATSGAWEYELDDAAANSLDEGDVVQEQFTATITDADGLTDTQIITITITGTNDRPVLDADSRNIAKDTASVVFDLSTLVSDVDQDDTVASLNFAIEADPTFGSASISGSELTFLTGTAFADLAPGETRNDTIDVRVTDDNGAFVIQTFTVTVTGNNEAPVITSSTADANGTATEDGVGSAPTAGADASGMLTYTDADERAGFPAQWSVVADSTTPLGRVEIDADTGAWEYFLDDAAANSLRQDAVVTETYTATVEDEFGASATQVMTMTITGTNDAPVIDVATSELGDVVSTGSPAVLTGQIVASDPDVVVAAAGWSILPNSGAFPTFGTMTISGAGEWRYDVNAAAVDALAAGETRVEAYTAIITDEFGASDTVAVTITVTGTNVAPIITSSTADAAGAVTESVDTPTGVVTASGQLTVFDPDETGTPAWTVAPISTVLLGSMSIGTTNGAWTYTLNDGAADSLDAGDEVTEQYLVTFTDSQGASVTQVLTITITGSNDSPTLTQTVTPTVAEDAQLTIDLRAIAGDVDAEDAVTDLSFAIAPGAFKGSASIVGGDLIFQTNGEFDDLAVGETEDVSINVTVSDGNGGETTSAITLEVTGANDDPVISVATSELTGAITEDGNVTPTPDVSVSGQLFYADVDEVAGTPATWSIAPSTSTLGGITIGATTGLWEYTLDQAAADALTEGQTVTEQFTATVEDAQGGTDSQLITITITGTNDAPTLTQVSTPVLSQNAIGFIDLRALSADVDDGTAGLIFALAPGAFKGEAQITGGELRFDPNGEFASLAAGETEDVTINVSVSDGNGGVTTSDITIRVSGENDAPEIDSAASAAQGSITEAGDIVPVPATSVGGTLTYTDTDEAPGTPATWSIEPPLTSTFGAIAIGATSGVWEYTLDQAAADSLTEGETRTETFTAIVTDAGSATDTQIITITITGTNDAPTLSAGTLAATEDGGVVTLDLATLGNDVDDGEDGTSLQYVFRPPPGGGSIPAGGTIFDTTLRYDVGNNFQALGEGETTQVVFNIAAADSEFSIVENTVTVTVTGVNDAPTVPDLTDTTTESGIVTIDLTGVGSDVDSTGLQYAIVDVPTEGFTQFLAGDILRFDTDGDFETLNAGETVDVVIGYTARDSLGATSTEGSVTITIQGQNDAPTLAAGTLSATENGGDFTLNLSTLGNDVDGEDDGNSLTYSLNGAVAGASVNEGILTFNADTGFEQLAVGETTDVTVGILARDSAGAEATNSVVVTVTGVNDDPTLAAGTLDAVEGGPAVMLDLANLAADPDTSDVPDLSYRIVTPVAGASITDSTLTFDPGAGFQNLAQGQEVDVSVSVEVDDGNGGTATNDVVVTVTGVNDNAVFADGTATVGERDGSTLINLSGLVTDVDDGQDGTTKTYIIDEPPLAGKGTVTIDGLGVRFDPNGDFDDLLAGESEDVTFTVQAVDVGDTSAVSNVATITVTVTGVNNPPDAQDFTVSHDGNAGALSIDALAQVLDDDDTVIEIVSLGAASAGNAVIDDMGTDDVSDDVILYTPNLVTDGSPDSFTYTVEDTAGNQDTGTITVNVPANSAPVAFDKSVSVALDSRAGMSFSADTSSYYEFVRGYYTWAEAQAAAAAQGGHLATIVNDDENSFVGGLVSAAGGNIDGWLGASDAAVEGEWRWVDGPETGQQFWAGTATGNTVGGLYENWFEGQPNAPDAGASDYLSIMRFGEGSWDDVLASDPRGYVLEKFASFFAGSFTNSDVINLDGGDTLTYALDTAIDGLTLDPNGFFTFDPNTDAYASLADGETLVINANYTATDERGASDTAAFTVTITGDNDAPTVVDDSAQVTAAVADTGPIGSGWTEWTAASGGNGHLYKFFSGTFDWNVARAAAASNNAHLATVTSAAENAFLGTVSGGFRLGWLGGSDQGNTNNWRWFDGPEAGQQFSQGSNSVGGSYTRWNVSEPNDPADPYLHFYSNGNWGDLGPGHNLGYYAEYSNVQFASGSVATNDTDVDGDDALITYALSGSYAGLAMATDGTWTFDRTDGAYEYLEAGEVKFINAYYTATDALGASSDGRLQIEVTGVNNAPVVADESDDVVVNVGAAPSGGGWSTFAGNGHLYDWVSGTFDYAQAVAGAEALGGHLATITSVEEQQYILSLRPSGENAFLGGSDAVVEGEWRWTAGPEEGEQFWQGDRTGAATNGAYTNWNPNNPDPGTAANEDVLLMFSDGRWGDVRDDDMTSYVVEYSNVPLVRGDVSLNDTDVEGQALSYVQNGTVAGFTLNTDGTWTFDATDAAYAGVSAATPQTVTVNYTATDTQGGSDTGTLTLNLTAENGAPVLGPDSEEITLIADPGPTGGGWLEWTEASGGNGHFYQFVSFTGNWAQARADAAAKGGYLATVTSAGEQAFINGLPGPTSVGWLAGSDEAVEGEWLWVEGPETGLQFWDGGISGTAVGGSYTNWDTANGGQPNVGTENALHTFGTGVWNNLTATDNLAGYYLEYSGSPVVTGSIATNDSDPDGDTITYAATNIVPGLTLAADGTWTFDRTVEALEAIGDGVIQTFTLTYTATDSRGATTDGTFDVAVQGINNAPELVTTDVDFGSFSETAGFQSFDLLTAASDPDIGDNLEVRNFTFAWSGDGPSPTITPVGGSIVELDPSLFTSLDAGETARLTMNYDVSDGTIDVAREAIVEITGVANTLQANSDNLSPTGIPAFNENSSAVITATQLLSNDTNTTGQALSIISVTGYEGINVTGYSQQAGALLTLSGGDIIYNGTHSARLNDLSGSQTLIDNFYYVIETADGLLTSTAEVAFVVQGLAPSGDAAPVSWAITGSGLGSGVSTTYNINTQFMRDDDESTGMVYKIGTETFSGHPDGALPDYLEFDPDFFNGFLNPSLNVNLSEYTGGSQQVTDLFLTGFEADGDYLAASFTVVLDSSGNIAHTKYGFDNAGITNLVELGIDPSIALGDITDGTGVDFDLSGLDALTPDTLRDVEVIQLQNSQENDLTIDLDDVLAIIEGNTGSGPEVVQLTVDAWDNVEIENNANWNTFYSTNEAVATLQATPGGAFAGSGFFLQFQMDGGTFDNIPSS